ncbi:MAG: tetratricopeptide repeat protein [Bacteroidota bacterium]
MVEDRLTFMEEMLDTNPNDPFLLYAIAVEYRNKGEEKKTEQIFTKLVKEHPEYLPSYYQLGQILEKKGKMSKAIALYRKGKVLAEKANDQKALGELSEALLILVHQDEY